VKKVIINIKKIIQVERGELVARRCGAEMSDIESVENGYIVIEGDKIAAFGKMEQIDSEPLLADALPELSEILRGETKNSRISKFADSEIEKICSESVEIIDAKERMVFPAFCDSHTHLVYAGSREIEYIDKIRGLSYQEIAARGGGILNSAALLHNTSEDELYRQTLERAKEIIAYGTGAVEIKSGYGLSLEDELKMLRVAKRIGEDTPLTVRSTFLGAHTVPLRYKGRREEYVDEIISEMIPVIATEELAEYIDVFTEEGFFSVEDTDRIFNAGMKYGLRPKVHANQMSCSGGVQIGVKYNAISVDHLEFTGEEEFRALKESETMATILPGSTFFLEMEYAPAREMIDYGLSVAIATNYNPGSSPYGDMRFMMGLAALKLKLTPEEIFNAVTLNGAYAMGLSETYGSIAVGKQANLFITAPIPSCEFIPYAFTTPLVDTVILNGEIV
jgi:imidazolonepropionase